MALKTIQSLPKESTSSPQGNAALKKINADPKVEAEFIKAIGSGDAKTTALILSQHGFSQATSENLALAPKTGGGGTPRPALQLPCEHIIRIDSYKDKQGHTVYVIVCA